MARQIVLLRGVNLVKRNRIAMPALRAALEDAGFRDVRTYVQSGNIVLTSRARPERLARDVAALVRRRFGLDLKVLVRTRDELARVVALDPLAGVASNHRRYLVTFLAHELPEGFADDLRKVGSQEPFAIAGREVYSWHPDGIGRTPLWERLASRSLGVDATSRNWATVRALLTMADQRSGR